MAVDRSAFCYCRWVGRRDYLADRLDHMSKSLEESNKDIHEMLLRVEEIKQTQHYNERL